MKLKTYVGRSLEELAPQIRDELGPEAVILSQRQGLKGGVGGFFGTKSIEVLAADRMPTEEQTAAALAGEPMPADDDSATGYSFAPEVESPIEAETETDAERAALVVAALGEMRARQTPAKQAAAAYTAPIEDFELPDFAGSIGPVEEPFEPESASDPIVVELREAKQGEGMRIAPRAADETHATSSDDAIELLDELDRAGVAVEIARAVVEAAERHLRPFKPDAPLRELVRARIRSVVRIESGWSGEGQRTLAVAGPSGAGKTTILLKLAERYCAAGLSVGLIALEPVADSGIRTRSVESMGESLAFDVRRAASVSAVRAARRAFADHDAVLIDTPGSAIADPEAREALELLLRECKVDELHAVLPLGLADRELAHVTSRLVELGANRVLPTKLDETRFAGALLTLAASSKLPLAYLGTGPRISDDLELADGGSICDRILPI
jgi:flagellar biosynthesis protein FlhF